MKKVILLLLAAITISSGFAFLAYRPNIEFDGIYVYKLDEENSAVIRFYEDGVVIVSTSNQ